MLYFQIEHTYNEEEQVINVKLNRFVKYCIKYIEGQNSVAVQLKIKDKLAKKKGTVTMIKLVSFRFNKIVRSFQTKFIRTSNSEIYNFPF